MPVLAFVALVATATVSDAARLFDGINDSLSSASTIDMTAYNKVSISLWAWWDAFANNDQILFETGTNFLNPVNGMLINPNSSGTSLFLITIDFGAATEPSRSMARPSAAVWHHYVVEWDRTVSGSGCNVAIYLDGVSQTLTNQQGGAMGGTFNNTTWNFMSRNNSSLFAAGRLAEVAVWSILLSQADVSALYGGGNGTLATNVQKSALISYWRLLGTTSPEPATVGSINLTVNGGAAAAAHPFLDPAPTSKAPKDPRSRSRGRGR